MKITINEKPAPKFKAFDVTISVESAAEQEALRRALKHYGQRHLRGQAHADDLISLAYAIEQGAK